MDKKLAMSVGIAVLFIGFIMLTTAINNYTALMERVGWYLEMFPSSTRYNSEIYTYYAMGFIGFILAIFGIWFAYYSANKRNK
jgi:uncharacterized membrane protein